MLKFFSSLLTDDFLLGLACNKARFGLSSLKILTGHDMDNRLDRVGNYRVGNSAPATIRCNLEC